VAFFLRHQNPLPHLANLGDRCFNGAGKGGGPGPQKSLDRDLHKGSNGLPVPTGGTIGMSLEILRTIELLRKLELPIPILLKMSKKNSKIQSLD